MHISITSRPGVMLDLKGNGKRAKTVDQNIEAGTWEVFKVLNPAGMAMLENGDLAFFHPSYPKFKFAVSRYVFTYAMGQARKLQDANSRFKGFVIFYDPRNPHRRIYVPPDILTDTLERGFDLFDEFDRNNLIEFPTKENPGQRGISAESVRG